MKALTICQPYAHLIVTGQKRVENRTWAPFAYLKGRLILIHAGKSKGWLTDEYPLPQNAAFGAIVGAATLADWATYDDVIAGKLDSKHPGLSAHEHVNGPWCFILTDVREFKFPIPFRGAQGFFDVPDTLVAAALAVPSTS